MEPSRFKSSAMRVVMAVIVVRGRDAKARDCKDSNNSQYQSRRPEFKKIKEEWIG